jgi:UPF0271 protein
MVSLNSDMGEAFGIHSFGHDDALVKLIDTANVACGFHAGDPARLRTVLATAAARGVAVGAQVSYSDLAGFGRRFMDVSYDDLVADVLYQAGGLQGLAAGLDLPVSYVKPHGALYHACSSHPAQGKAVADAADVLGVPVLAAVGSPFFTSLRSLAVGEAFVDRGYLDDGSLVSRSEPGSVLSDIGEVCERAVRLATEGTVVTVTGAVIEVPARSLCVHGDTPGAAALARRVRVALEDAGVTVAAFT